MLEIRILKDDIKAFMSHCTDFFGPYQASCMGVPKFYFSTHIPDDLRDTGGIEYSCSGLYEMSHKAFEDVYKNNSKCKTASM